MSAIFGGSKQSSWNSSSSETGNKAYNFVNNNFGQTGAKAYNRSTNMLMDKLGSFQKYRDATGFDFMEKLGLGNMAGNFSGRGAFQSGAALKSLANFENGLEKQSYNDYLDKVLALGQQGAMGGQMTVDAGNWSKSKSQGYGTGSSNKGIGETLGAVASIVAASDRRLKKDIKLVGTLANGLNVYEYKYVNDKGPYIGVMADEVADKMPEALGPVVDGYATVDYGKLKGMIENE